MGLAVKVPVVGSGRISVMPFKFHRNYRRHHIPRQKFRVTNWRDYEAAIAGSHGSLTIWFTAKAIEADWRAQPGVRRQADSVTIRILAIETALTLTRSMGARAWLCVRRKAWSVRSCNCWGLTCPFPITLNVQPQGRRIEGAAEALRASSDPLHLIIDSTGLKLRGAGEWLFEKHGTAKRRAWRKLHIGIDADDCGRDCRLRPDRQGC